MPSRASPYGASSRRNASQKATQEPGESLPRDASVEPTYAQTVCARIQEAIQGRLSPLHCVATDVSIADLQYRCLGAKRYWYRSVKQEKSGAKRWEARYFEVVLRRSTLEKLRSVVSWHAVERLSADDVQLRSLGLFDSEKQAAQAFDAAFRARDATNPLRVGTTRTTAAAGEKRLSWSRQQQSLPQGLATRFQLVVVSAAFERLTQRQRLGLVYETLLDAFSASPTIAESCRVRGIACIGDRVASLSVWRALPFHVTVVAKTPTQWKPGLSGKKHELSDTERFGLSHLRNDRALGVDSSIFPMSRGLLDLVTSSNQQVTDTRLPHFYHGLPEELKRLMRDEQGKANEMLASPTNRSTAFQKLSRNTEAGFMKKYLKRKRDLVLAATRLQRVLRRNAQGKILRFILKCHRASLRIQCVYRGHRDREYVAAYRMVVHSASTIIQAVYRSHTSRERTKRLRAEMTRAALDIQRVYRGHGGRKWTRWVRQTASSAVEIERVARGFMARRRAARWKLAKFKRRVQIPAATVIQRLWRGHHGRRIAAAKRESRQQLYVLNPAAICIGRILRGFLARRMATRFRVACHSARVIQKHWRSHRYHAKWMALMDHRRRDRMASRIGALGRGYVARQFFLRERRRVYQQCVVVPAVVRIQRVFRGYVVRKQHEDIRDRVEAAITLQQMWRKRRRIRTIQYKLTGFRVAIRNASATRIQYWYKCCKAKERFAFLHATQRARHGRAALVIQCAWRSICSRQQLEQFRLCSRIERKAQALTSCKEKRDDIEFDIRDARADLTRTIKFKAKSLRRIKELKEMRLEWERRQPVVDKELRELTQEDLDRGWGEAFQTEQHVLRFQLELSVEDVLGHRDQIRAYDAEIEDLRLELEDLERDLEECIMDETMELEAYRDMEMQRAQHMVASERARRIRRQRVRWGVRNDRRHVIYRARDDLQVAERELLAQRQVQELGVLGFEKKLLLKDKMQSAIERVVQDRARQSAVVMELRRDAKVVQGFDEAIQRMRKITNEYTFEYRIPKHDLRELAESPMCDACGRLSCDCEERERSIAARGS